LHQRILNVEAASGVEVSLSLTSILARVTQTTSMARGLNDGLIHVDVRLSHKNGAEHGGVYLN
jgi:hypothetical protein